jgi:SpoIIAA-like
MPIQLSEENGGTVLAVHVSGKLVKSDYEQFVPEFDRLVRQHGKLCVLFDMTGFHCWEQYHKLQAEQVDKSSSLCSTFTMRPIVTHKTGLDRIDAEVLPEKT